MKEITDKLKRSQLSEAADALDTQTPMTLSKGLVQLGLSGHYPLLNQNEMAADNSVWDFKRPSEDKRHLYNQTIKKLEQHRNWERKKTLFWSLPRNEQIAFHQVLIYLVEQKLLDDIEQLN